MKRKMTVLAVASAVLALSAASSAGAEPSTIDARAQAAVVLTARSQFHVAHPTVRAGADADAQSQARALLRADQRVTPARIVADSRVAPLPARSDTQFAHRGPNKNADAQSMAATVLLGRGA